MSDYDETLAPIRVTLASVDKGVTIPRGTSSQVSGYGFTLSRVGTPNIQSELLLGEDPLRIRALISANVVFYLGNAKEMAGISQTITAGSGGPGSRCPQGTLIEIRSQDVVWVGYSANTELGVWVERRVPGGTL